MGAKWMRVETDFVDHPKVRRLSALLGESCGGWYILRAWAWVSRFCPTGHVRDTDGTAFEAACEWRGEPGKLLSTLVVSGFLEALPEGGWEVHDWAEHQGKVAQRAQKDRERKRVYREKLSHGTSRGRPADVPRTHARDISPRPAQRDVTGRDVTGRKGGDGSPRASDLLAGDFREVVGQPYAWKGAKDGVALAEMLKVADLDEVRRRWRIGLKSTGWQQVCTVAQLHQKWNDLAVAGAAAPAARPQSRRL